MSAEFESCPMYSKCDELKKVSDQRWTLGKRAIEDLANTMHRMEALETQISFKLSKQTELEEALVKHMEWEEDYQAKTVEIIKEIKNDTSEAINKLANTIGKTIEYNKEHHRAIERLEERNRVKDALEAQAKDIEDRKRANKEKIWTSVASALIIAITMGSWNFYQTLVEVAKETRSVNKVITGAE